MINPGLVVALAALAVLGLVFWRLVAEIRKLRRDVSDFRRAAVALDRKLEETLEASHAALDLQKILADDGRESEYWRRKYTA